MNNLSRMALGAVFLGFTGSAAAAPTETVLYGTTQSRSANQPNVAATSETQGTLLPDRILL